MDFEVVGGLDSGGVICSDNTNMQKWYGSGGFHKHQRSEDEWSKDNKLAKTNEDDFSSSKATLLFQQHLRSSTNSNPISLDTQQMLSFSSPTVSSMPYYHLASSAFARNASGCGSVSLSGGSMHGVIGGVKGPFTPSQWMELEHQALIYKYITANVPIPPYLLNPIRKALESAGFTAFAGLRPNALGWGAFHLGFSSSNDPEPGRCRRTDGKKWRCSRDAVVDQKYCERHMNRGRHRSRKPVEGQTAAATSSKLINLSSSASVTAAASSNNLGLSTHHQLNKLPQPAVTNLDRSFIDKESAVVSTNVQREHNFYRETSKAEFGLVCADSLINPLNKNTSLVNQGSETQHNPLRQFMDDWPKKHSTDQSDRTQLSISIGPVVASDFMSSNDKLTASPLSREHEATQMGLGIGTIINEHSQQQGSWIPVSWESSMGGPLGEVLHSTNSSSGDCKNKSALNLMTEGWDRSPRMGSSPTGVLQKTSFGSLSNSSAGSSPRTENGKINEGSSLCNGLLGASLMNPILPAM